jgi:hypothetical protein
LLILDFRLVGLGAKTRFLAGSQGEVFVSHSSYIISVFSSRPLPFYFLNFSLHSGFLVCFRSAPLTFNFLILDFSLGGVTGRNYE